VTPGSLGYLLDGHEGIPTFDDTSTYDAEAGESPNVYQDLWLSNPDRPVRIFTKATVTYLSPP
jgi:hypothetical protein